VPSTRRTLAHGGAVLGCAMLLAVPLAAQLGGASSHREAPLIAQDPTVDVTDVYAFVSPDAPNTVTLIANWIPFEEPAGGPNFYHFSDNARYLIKVDRDGDGKEDITYEWTFETDIQNPDTFLYNTGPITSLNDADYNYRQTYSLALIEGKKRTVLTSDKLVPPDNIGPRSTPDYEDLADDAIYDLGDGIKTFAGQRDDPFYVDVGSIFDLGGLRPFNAAHLIPLSADPGIDTLGGFNIHTTAIQVPRGDLAPDCNVQAARRAGLDTSCVIGVWATAERNKTTVRKKGQEKHKGKFVQVARLGNPLVNEVVVPLGAKDQFNNTPPTGDGAFLGGVTDPELARLFCVLYDLDTPGLNCKGNVPGSRTADRDDLVTVFLTGIPNLNQQAQSADKPSEQLRLNLSIAPTAGVCDGNPLGVIDGDNAGFPNGRRLEDDVVDIELRAVAGGYVLTPEFQDSSPHNDLGDGVNENDRNCRSSFPYMGTPHQGYEHEHHPEGEESTPT
jgi:hypothetical protein